MSAKADLGLDAVHRIAKLWMVDDDRIRWNDNGFDWWPGRFKVSVRSEKRQDESDGPAWRLTVRTALLKDIPTDQARLPKDLFTLASLAPTYAWIYTPVGLAKLSHDESNPLDERSLWLQSTVYLRDYSTGWLPDFLSGLAILQPIDAEWLAEVAAEALGGSPDVSRPSDTATTHLDDMLNLAKAVYLPAGQEANRWQGSGEFEDFVAQLGRSDVCFGVTNPGGLTLETPIGSHTATIRIRMDGAHPFLGTGLLATVHLPFSSEEEAAGMSLWLTLKESAIWTDIPVLASWCPLQAANGRCEACNAFFIPNALYRPDVAFNAALWQFARARLMKSIIWPDLKDLTMAEILRERFARSGRPN
jgi:hypothetical protein